MIFFRNRTEIIHLIEESANEFYEIHKSVKITKVVTGSTGTAGTLLCLTGLTLAIPTDSLSIFLTIDGSTLAAADCAITLPIQIIDLAANGHALHKKKTSDTSKKLRQLAQQFSTQAANVKIYIEDQRMQMNF
ncbi:unnamed protein product [Rotaria sordida]|uniref:Uncharacterized protein n=1 Tax=Rotaria sordida TaxID=392033 RepID=A0A813TYQ3_9BILA|nr:unnamed protein product [Rotaria sordida]CAF0816022.1 unnamed protein product [Rotaria sordida]